MATKNPFQLNILETAATGGKHFMGQWKYGYTHWLSRDGPADLTALLYERP